MSKYGQNTTFGFSSNVKIRAEYGVRIFFVCQITAEYGVRIFVGRQHTGKIRRSDSRRTSACGQNTAFVCTSDSQYTDVMRRTFSRRIQNTMPEDAEQEARHRSSVPQPATAALECLPSRAFLTQNEGSTPPPLLLRRRHRNGNTRPSFVVLPQKTLFFATARADSIAHVFQLAQGMGRARDRRRGQPNYLFVKALCLNQ